MQIRKLLKMQIRKLSDLMNTDVIHCPTSEQATQLCKLLHDNGYTWSSNEKYSTKTEWRIYTTDTCYNISSGTFASLDWYKNNGYNIISYDDFFNLMPKYFVIKKVQHNPLWKEYIGWLNNRYNNDILGDSYTFYGYDGKLDCQYDIKRFQNNPVLLTLEEWDYIINKKEMNKSKTINYSEAQEIIDISCTTWKTKLAKEWATSIVLKDKMISISEAFYKEMRNACTSEQNILFDRIFGKDKTEFLCSDLAQGECMIITTDSMFKDKVIMKLNPSRYVFLHNGDTFDSDATFIGKKVKIDITHTVIEN